MRRTAQFLRNNVGPTFLTSGAVITVLTAPSDPIAGPLVQAGGGALALAGLCLYVFKNAKEKWTGVKTVASLISGLAGLSACATLGGNGFYQMAQAQNHHWWWFGAFIAGANFLPFFFGNGGVTVDGIRSIKNKSEDHPPTNWNGIAINYTLGGLGLFLAGASVYPDSQEVGRNLMVIGGCFMGSGASGLSFATMPKTVKQAVQDTGAAARQAVRVVCPFKL
ncbi:MAG TPA: hypothetical protein PKW15_08540 [Alphaproteobacteria bacterium]|nr:hypothetical protein [Rhodospirillaceae bacterium]HRJ13274.1 hypothetical protein [Alphaproteobacteria bacterium]